MPSLPPTKYTYHSYSLGCEFTEALSDVVMTKPSWWRRVFLREKPKPTGLSLEIAHKLGEAARKAEEEMIRKIFTDGRKE